MLGSLRLLVMSKALSGRLVSATEPQKLLQGSFLSLAFLSMPKMWKRTLTWQSRGLPPWTWWCWWGFAGGQKCSCTFSWCQTRWSSWSIEPHWSEYRRSDDQDLVRDEKKRGMKDMWFFLFLRKFGNKKEHFNNVFRLLGSLKVVEESFILEAVT